MSPECVQCGQQLTGHRIAGGRLWHDEVACSTLCLLMYVYGLDETEAEAWLLEEVPCR